MKIGNGIINLEYLRKYMNKNKISETKLAKLVGVNYTTAYRIFRGARNPGAKFIAGLLKSGLDIDYNKIFLNDPLLDGNVSVNTFSVLS